MCIRDSLGWEHKDPFFVPEEVKKHIAELCEVFEAEENQWKELFEKYSKAYPELAEKYKAYMSPVSESVFDEDYWTVEDKAVATRPVSYTHLNSVERFWDGCMNCTRMKKYPLPRRWASPLRTQPRAVLPDG